MQILTDIYGEYKWYKVKTKNKAIFFTKNHPYCYIDIEGVEHSVYEKDILATKGNLNKYVFCSHCRELIINDDAHIEKHCLKSEAKADCFSCGYMKLESNGDCTKKYKKQENGTYNLTQKGNFNLYCRINYSNDTPEYNKQRHLCKYYACRKNRDNNIKPNMFILTHPNPYNKIITENGLIQNGWSIDCINTDNRVYKYKNKNLYAVVKSNGVVDYFKRNNIVFRYSDKYKMYLRIWNSSISELDYNRMHNMKLTESIKEIIERLYV